MPDKFLGDEEEAEAIIKAMERGVAIAAEKGPETPVAPQEPAVEPTPNGD